MYEISHIIATGSDHVLPQSGERIVVNNILSERNYMVFKSYDYDLKNEIEEYKQSGADDLYKFLLYKSSAVEMNFDCDRCAYAKSVYHKLWGFDNSINTNFQNIHVGNQLILMGMDTMNSFWTTFAWCLNKWCREDIHRDFGITNVTANSAKDLLDNYAAFKKIIIKNLSKEIFDKFVLFAKLTHTIGNLVLVPKKIEPYTHEKQTFNMARASKWNDYFDLSLQWILRNDEQSWNEETVNMYFDIFELRDYVTENNKIIPLIESHKKIINGVENIESRPQDKLEIVQFLDNINNRIIKRGNILYTKLNNTESLKQEIRHIEQDTKTDSRKNEVKSQSSEYNSQAKKIFVKNLIFHIVCVTILFPIIALMQAAFFTLESLSALIVLIIVLLIEYGAFIFLAYWLANRKKCKYLKARSIVSSNGKMKIKRIIRIKKSTVISLIVWIVWMAFGITTYFDEMSNLTNGFMKVYIIYMMICFAAIPFIIVYLRYGIKLRCRECKFFYMLKKERLEKYSEDNISIKVINENKNSYGEVTSTREQYVPGTRVYYRQYYRCKLCGNIHYAPYSKEYLID